MKNQKKSIFTYLVGALVCLLLLGGCGLGGDPIEGTWVGKAPDGWGAEEAIMIVITKNGSGNSYFYTVESYTKEINKNSWRVFQSDQKKAFSMKDNKSDDLRFTYDEKEKVLFFNNHKGRLGELKKGTDKDYEKIKKELEAQYNK
ncbi:MAG: hypothetical protein E7198_11035 [Schwartzia succinivorans]|uniref:hypothetical protein n=1 Tax=Schwartzia succinivorans TaxID=55507 RepID=UPI0023535308|nr:hypothetical protein [Schwartzia succinivorans]MBE6098300.1 hypothetical protein [Schwartzia succinivorans]